MCSDRSSRTRSTAKFNFIPYRSAGESQKDLVGGQVDMIIDTPSTSGQNVKNGLIKAYVLAGKDRTPVLPDLPTVDEAGLPGMYFYFWHAHLGAEGHAQAGHRQAQRSGDEGGGRSGDARAAGQDRPGVLPDRR